MNFQLQQESARNLFVQIVSLVVYDDECRKIYYLYLPDSLHSQVLVVEALHLLDIFVGKQGSRSPDGPEVESPVFFAGIRHLLTAISLGDHDKRATLRLEEIHI